PPKPRPRDGHGEDDRYKAAMGLMIKAVTARAIEPICTTYLGLRAAGGGMPGEELLDRVDFMDSGQARGLIVAAFSKRRCLMCRTGAAECAQCEGTGLSEGHVCSHCEGLGVEVCEFCQGAGWSDVDQAPVEIRQKVLERRISRVRRDLSRLATLTMDKALRSARKANPMQRRETAEWMLRLRARLESLSRFLTNTGAIIGRIDRVLEALRVQPLP
ncbi:hypothetical protein LCGC14_2807210, partial [marine sediment metagenome]